MIYLTKHALFVFLFKILFIRSQEVNELKEIKINVLYENTTKNSTNNLYFKILKQKIDSLNNFSDLNFNLNELKSYEQFKDENEYTELSFFAGSNEIEERIDSLNKKNENYLLLISSSLGDTIYQKEENEDECFKTLLVNRNSDFLRNEEILFQLEKSLDFLILRILGFDLSNFDNLNVKEILKKNNFKENVKKCYLNENSNNKNSKNSKNKNKRSFILKEDENSQKETSEKYFSKNFGQKTLTRFFTDNKPAVRSLKSI